MPTSAAGSSCGAGRAPAARRSPRRSPTRRPRRLPCGFTLVELLVVLLIVALSAGVVALALRDSDASRLEEEGARLAALLEMARAESRVTGAPVRWVPLGADSAAAGGTPAQFAFVGLHPGRTWPTRWLQPGVAAAVVADGAGAAFVALGPDAILPPQRVRLRLNDRLLELASDGLGPFAVVGAAAAGAAGAEPAR
jgi:general secretion pathway protein H